MLSSKRVNNEVIKMYKGKAYIETNITLYTELDKNSELYKNFKGFMGNIEPTLKGLNDNIEEIIMDNFEDNSDIAEISSSIKGL